MKNKKYEKITISFTEVDEDIVRFVEELKKSNKASEFIREAIREKISEGVVSNEVLQEIIELKKEVAFIKNQMINANNNVTIKEVKVNDDLGDKKKEDRIDEDLLEAVDFFN